MSSTAPTTTPPRNSRETAGFREIVRLTIPQMLMMLCQFTVGMVDVFVAGRIAPEVQATLGLMNTLLFFLLIVAMSTAQGAVAAISQSAGAGKRARMLRYIMLVLSLGFVASLVLLALGYPLQGPLLDIIGAPKPVRDVALFFLDVYMLTLVPYYLFVISGAVFRAQKLVLFPLGAAFAVAVVNTILDLGLGLGMFGMPNMGYQGLAWATLFSVSAGAAVNLYNLHRLGLLRFSRFPPMRWIRPALAYLYRVAWPGALSSLIWQTGYMGLYAIVARLPNDVDAMAGMAAGMRVESLLFMPGFAFSMTASILVGQELGARDVAGAKDTGLRILGTGVALISAVTFVLWQFIDPDGPAAAFIVPDMAARQMAVDYLFWNMLAIPATQVGLTLMGALSGAGATFYNLIIFSIGAWCVRLPLAWLLGHGMLMGAEGVWIAMFISQTFQAVLALAIFLRAPWWKYAQNSRRLS